MKKLVLLVLALAAPSAFLAVRPVLAQRATIARLPEPQQLSYGSDPLQVMNFWRGQNANAPLILFVHGGGWARGTKENATGEAKVRHFTQLGYAFASIDYRLVPQARVEDEADDVARAVAWVIAHKAELGIDGRGIVVMGHSAGAHLAALVGTDPKYLKAHGVPMGMLAGVILLDGAGYDVPMQIDAAGPLLRRMYEQAFGLEPGRQMALSPITHVAAPNARAFLILHVERADSERQSNMLAAALRKAGTLAEVSKIEDSSHMRLNRGLGGEDDAATALVDSFAFRAFQGAGVVLPPRLKAIGTE